MQSYIGTQETRYDPKKRLFTLKDVMFDTVKSRVKGDPSDLWGHLDSEEESGAIFPYLRISESQGCEERMYNLRVLPKKKIILPKEIHKTLNLDKKVLIIGSGDHMELWKPQIYAAFETASPPFDEIADQLFDSYDGFTRQQEINPSTPPDSRHITT